MARAVAAAALMGCTGMGVAIAVGALACTAAAVALGVATPAFASPGSHDEAVSDTSDAIRVVDAPVEIQDILSIDPDDSFSRSQMGPPCLGPHTPLLLSHSHCLYLSGVAVS